MICWNSLCHLKANLAGIFLGLFIIIIIIIIVWLVDFLRLPPPQDPNRKMWWKKRVPNWLKRGAFYLQNHVSDFFENQKHVLCEIKTLWFTLNDFIVISQDAVFVSNWIMLDLRFAWFKIMILTLIIKRGIGIRILKHDSDFELKNVSHNCTSDYWVVIYKICVFVLIGNLNVTLLQ